jgi:predicted house-cleaning noncanonical NTP pyrophosphatase (MazG superfamily)
MDTPSAPRPDPSAPARAKLVRDRIPDIIRAEGREPVVTVDRGIAPLLDKLQEEAAEVRGTIWVDAWTGLDEMADVLEVLRSLASRVGLTLSDIVVAADRKRVDRGGFGAGYILHPETDRP